MEMLRGIYVEILGKIELGLLPAMPSLPSSTKQGEYGMKRTVNQDKGYQLLSQAK